jgi:hypothetical protein
MPGYEIFEKKHLKPYKEDGIVSCDIKIGFLDFLREIKNYAEEIPPLSSFTVVGIEEVLYRIHPDECQTMARAIHTILQRAASTLERKKVQVQITCKDRLMRGESLWLEYRGERLPIDYIFGSTITNDIRGMKVYTAGFNLST